MNIVNAVQLLILGWSFSACQADTDDFSVSCDNNVIGTVGNKVTFTCSINEKCSNFCVTYYHFKYPESYGDSVLYEEEVQDCEERNSFTYSYSPTSAIMGQFRFFIQAICGQKTTEFKVNISGELKKAVNKATNTKGELKKAVNEAPDTKGHPNVAATASALKGKDKDYDLVPVFIAVVSCFIIVVMAILFSIRRRKCVGLCNENDSAI